jgi:glutamyl/glutaminyl-tRNA synthetase
MCRVRFPPSPTGSLHVGNALTAAANRAFGDWLLLRIDDTDATRTVEHGERDILRDLEWLGIVWDEGPVRQSERQDLYRAASEKLGGDRFGKTTLLRPDGTARIRRLAVEAISAMPDEELAARVGVSLELVPAVRGARDLQEAREYARQILEPEPVQLPAEARSTLERFKELVDGDARQTLRELKAAGGDLRALRLALTGRERGPELWTVIHALPREEALRRVDAAL